MKYAYLALWLLAAPLTTIAQHKAEIASATVTFVYLSNDVDGSISGFESASSIDLENPTNSVFKGTVAAETLKTGNFLRDWSIKGGKYFDADNYPKIRFASTTITANGNNFKVKGNLTIKDKTVPTTIDFVLNNKTLTGTTTVNSSDFGINVKKKREDNKVSVKMVFQLK